MNDTAVNFLVGGGLVALCTLVFLLGRYSIRLEKVEEKVEKIEEFLDELHKEMMQAFREVKGEGHKGSL
jgi:uncharacterized membrane protein YdjX (TVP38/TMEM64 family)